MSSVLIVEDEHDLLTLVDYNLRAEGYETLTATTGEEGLALARSKRPDVLILDLMLPGLSGLEICRQLKQETGTRHIPILILTARGEEVDRVVGFELGADDYVVKPFSVRELVLRVQAILRRTSALADPGAATVFGRLRVDTDAFKAYVDNKICDLTALEFRLLQTLLERRGRVQTRDMLLDDVWGQDAALSVTPRTVDTHVKRLRQKLEAAGDYIETVRGVGYRFAEHPSGDDA